MGTGVQIWERQFLHLRNLAGAWEDSMYLSILKVAPWGQEVEDREETAPKNSHLLGVGWLKKTSSVH